MFRASIAVALISVALPCGAQTVDWNARLQDCASSACWNDILHERRDTMGRGWRSVVRAERRSLDACRAELGRVRATAADTCRGAGRGGTIDAALAASLRDEARETRRGKDDNAQPATPPAVPRAVTTWLRPTELQLRAAVLSQLSDKWAYEAAAADLSTVAQIRMHALALEHLLAQ